MTVGCIPSAPLAPRPLPWPSTILAPRLGINHPPSAIAMPGGSPVQHRPHLGDRPGRLSPAGGQRAMSHSIERPSRRLFLGAAAGAAFFTTRGLFAEELARTPSRTEGPFYPDKLPLDQDNDLILIKDSLTPAVGEITHLSGRILDAGGSPIRDATIE